MELQKRPALVPAGLITGIAVLALVAALLVGWSTSRYGIGVSPDSAHYIGVARSLGLGHGLWFNGAPYTHWPPIYPLLLAGVGAVGLDPLNGARLLAILLYPLNLVLASCLAYHLSDRSTYAGIAAGLLYLASPELLHIHMIALSEPPFLCLTFLSLLLFCQPGAHRARWQLAAAGLCAGGALLTRYAGAALLPAFVLCIAASGRTGERRPLREALTFLCAACSPLAGWLLYTRLAEHAASDRPLVFHAPGGMAIMLLPLSALGTVWLARSFRQARRCETSDAETILSLWIPAFLTTYCAFVFFSICFLDALTPVDAHSVTGAGIRRTGGDAVDMAGRVHKRPGTRALRHPKGTRRPPDEKCASGVRSN